MFSEHLQFLLVPNNDLAHISFKTMFYNRDTRCNVNLKLMLHIYQNITKQIAFCLEHNLMLYFKFEWHFEEITYQWFI